MDELQQLEGPTRFPSRRRSTSIHSSGSRQRPVLSPDSPTTPYQPHIIAPTPRRHLLETSESQRWLRTPPHSPASSRATSPGTRHFDPPSPSLARRRGVGRHLSFSSLTEAFPITKVGGPSQPVKIEEGAEGEAGTGKRWVRWMHRQGIKGWVVPVLIVASTWFKWCISLGSYSGQGTPPTFGDYEAQRHWMELTIHLPIRQWYTYDSQYWGLDYPPLTAYLSWLCGIVGAWIEPSWFALDKSRGIETAGGKVFMRATVLAFDLIIYVPALLMFVHTWLGSRSRRTQNLAFLVLLFQPGLLLIDYGHFQYNSVMLGLTLLSINFFASGKDLLGAICFTLSLGFKQMALYYAPAVGIYLISKCIYLGRAHGWHLFIRLAGVTITSFLILFLPFLPPLAPLSAVLDPITRIFPFNRGLFEDKVANFWCASDIVFKWRKWGSRLTLIRLSTVLTALGFFPSVFVLINSSIKLRSREKVQVNTRLAHTPTLPLLPYALLTTSMSFFLFSFQVHEKTILIPLLPMNLLLSGSSPDSTLFAWGVLVNNVAVFSMWPLLKRDGLAIQYLAVLLLWNRLLGYDPFRPRDKFFIRLVSLAVHAAIIGLHILELFITPPARYPDIFPVLNLLVCTPVFVLVWLWSIKCSFEVAWALETPVAPVTTPSATSPARRQSVVTNGGRGEGASTGVEGIRRGVARAMSLGHLRGKRRAQFSSSVDGGRP